MAKQLTYEKITVTVTTAGTAVPISGSSVITSQYEVFVPQANTGDNIYIGDVDVDNTYIPRAKQFNAAFVASEDGDLTNGDYFDLKDIYVDADTSGDTLIVQYVKSLKG